MAVNKKHLATFLLGAAAGVALNKYAQSEEGKELMDKLKNKGEEFRKDAEASLNKSPEYFDSLKNEATGTLNEILAKLKATFPDAENILTDLFKIKEVEKAEQDSDDSEKKA